MVAWSTVGAPQRHDGDSSRARWAAVEHDPFAPQGDVRWAWMVRLTGVFAAPPCPTQGPGAMSRPNASVACVDGDGGLDVVLDYYTGAFVGWTN